ncbi:MAG: glycoside hydrolase family 127 protein, partial [Clostridia bacterium]|nr:glycoside hydrolase family 127 protein [Clostridia bacterium]
RAECVLDGAQIPCEITQASAPDGTAEVRISGYDSVYSVEFSVLSIPMVSINRADVTEVEFLDGFWGERMTQYSSDTINAVFDRLVEQGVLRNFDKIINGVEGYERAEDSEGAEGSEEAEGYEGFPWQDGMIYETIAAAGDFLAVNDDAALKARVDEYIDVIYEASMVSENGFFSACSMMEKPGLYFDDNGGEEWQHDFCNYSTGGKGVWYHDAYNFGCLAEAAVHYYKATGDKRLLFVAARFAEFIADNYGYGEKPDGTQKINMVPSHSMAEETMLELYCLLRDTEGLTAELESFDERYPLSIDIEEYADLVRFWIENKGNYDGRADGSNYGDYAQDHAYYFEQTEAKGHAVRANLFYTGMAAAGGELGELTYLSTARELWEGITEKKMYITGGVGAAAVDEAYGADYELPNDGYCETCAQVAMAFFGNYLSENFEDASYADVIERLMYNGILGCLSEDGTHFYYQQPLSSAGSLRWSWHECPCCPPMFLKFYSTLANYVYAYSDDAVYVDQFVSSRFSHDGITVTQQSELPWFGHTSLTVEGGDTALMIRLPSWATDGVEIMVNGAAAQYDVRNGYAVIDAHDGDTVEMNITMKAHRAYSDERVAANVGRVAFTYGPVVYCVEGVDNGNLQMSNFADNGFAMTKDSELSASFEEDLLGGVVVIEAEAVVMDEKVTCRLIPFYARANRGEWQTYVWVKEQQEK